MKKIQFIAILLLVFSMLRLQAQDAITATGGNASGLGGTVSYSVGQIVYSTHSNLNGSVSQGVQQPYEISVATAVEQAKDISLEIVLYPNPTQDFIKLKIGNHEEQNLNYRLYDIKGSILSDSRIVADETDIIMKNYSSGTYFLRVNVNNKEIKTFKIIKN